MSHILIRSEREKEGLAQQGLPSPEEFDAAPLIGFIGPLPHVPPRQGVAAPIALFHKGIALGQLTMDMLH